MNNNFARLTGLTPKTNYYFVIVDNLGTSQEYWFTTISDDPNDDLAILGGGDSRNNRTPRRNANNVVDKLNPHFVMFAGDMTDTDSNAEWDDWFADWYETYNDDRKIIPILPARGNHENANSSIYDLFDTPNSGVYFALNFGGNLLRIYTLNSESSVATQGTWLQNDLAANGCDVYWKSAQYHRPIIPHEPGKTDQQDQFDAWAHHFYNYQVKFILECDAHVCKTTYPIKPTTWGDNSGGAEKGYIRDDDEGSVFVGEGCWGAPTRSTESFAWTRAFQAYFNQIKWVFVSQNKIEARTIATDQVASVGTTSYSNVFDITKLGGSSLWTPASGSVVTVYPSLKPKSEVSSPADGTNYLTPQLITINANTSDYDGTVTQVEFFVNSVSIGVDNTAPFSINYNIPAVGTYEITTIPTDNDGKTGTSCSINTITCGNPPVTINIPVATSNDDAEEIISSGAMSLTSTDLELIHDASDQYVGIRFQNVTVPKGAIINSAYIQFTTDETVNTNVMNVTIQGDNVDDSAPFSTTNFDVSSRTKTTASTNWNPPAWNTVGERNANQRTSDISSVVQEIVNRPGWSTSNDMSFILEATTGATRIAEAGPGGDAPMLSITYNPGNITVNIAISDDLDDVEEAKGSGTIYNNSSDLEIGYDGFVSDDQIIGLRFRNVSVPQGATIASAYIQFQCDEAVNSNGNGSTYTVFGEDVSNSSSFNTTAFDISSRTLTSSSVSWTTSDWTVLGEQGVNQRASDISPIVSELTSRVDWVNGNSMTFIFNGGAGSKRVAGSFDGGNGAVLVINYTDPGVIVNTNFVYFNSRETESGAFLEWKISNTEKEQIQFEVYKSVDGQHFKKLDTEISELNENSFFALDKSFSNIGYYKIKLINEKNNFFSHVQKLVSTSESEFITSLYPNPIHGKSFFIRSAKAIDRIDIFSLNGVKINHQYIEKGDGLFEIVLDKATKGTYLLVAYNNEKKQIKKFIIE